jgi:hypothetical protein
MKNEWSQAEIARTIAEVQRRSAVEPQFRSLALRDPLGAIRSVNPRPVPTETSVLFVEDEATADRGAGSLPSFVVVLPPLANRTDELSDAELEDVAGGNSTNIVIRS